MTTNHESQNETPVASKPRLWLMPLLSSLLLSFTVCLFAPLETYLSVNKELWFPISEFFPACLLLFLAAFALTFGLSMLLRGTARKVVCALYTGFSLCVFIQASFLNADYGLLDGRAIDWDQYGSYGRWNGLIWIVVTLVPVALILPLKQRFSGVLKFVSILLLLTQLASVGALSLTLSKDQKGKGIGFLTEKQFELSKENNIVVFVLDTLDRSTAASYLSAHPELQNKLDGFTLFQNSTGLFSATQFALPVLLTNQIYRPEIDYASFLEEAWPRSDLMNRLKQSGYASYVYTSFTFATRSAMALVDNTMEQTMRPRDSAWLLFDMAKLTGFRHAPHSFKKLFGIHGIAVQENQTGNDSPLYVLNDQAFFQSVKNNEITASLDQPAFHFYHLQGAHPPYVFQSDGTKASDGTSVVQVQDACYTMLLSFFDQMRDLGIYDSATIVITADHGSLLIDAAPMLMIKRPNEHGALQQNTALISQLDIAATIASAAHLTPDVSTGIDAFSPAAGEQTTVPFYHRMWPYDDRFYEYAVSLNKQQQPQYSFTGRIFTSDGEARENPPIYELGAWQSWTSEAFALDWMENSIWRSIKEWSYQGVWFGRLDATLRLKLASKTTAPLRLRLGVININDASQPLVLLHKGKVIGETAIQPGDSEACIMLPPEIMSDDVLTLTLHFPNTANTIRVADYSDESDNLNAALLSGFSIEEVK